MRRFSRKRRSSHSARHVPGALLASYPLGALSRAPPAPRDLFLNADLFSPKGCPCSHPVPPGPWITERFSLTAISTRAVLQRSSSRPIELLPRVPPVFEPSLEMRDASCLRHRHMQVLTALYRDTTFKFSKATTFRIPVIIYVCRKEYISSHE